MCISCGCGKANDDHGDSRNITLSDLNQAAQAAGTTRDRVLQNIMQGAQSGANGTDQSQSAPQSQQPAYNQAQAQQRNAGVQGAQDLSSSSNNQENNYGQIY